MKWGTYIHRNSMEALVIRRPVRVGADAGRKGFDIASS